MNIKGIIRQTLYEADESVTGDDRAHQAATADLAVDRVKERMAGMGARPDLAALRGVTTIEQLSVEPFKYNFLLQVKDKAQELTIPKPIEFNTLARVNSVDNGLVLELKTEDDTNFNVKNGKGEISVKIPGGSIFKINFDADELVTNLPGTKKGIQAIATGDDGGKGKFYNIGIFDDFIKLLNTGVSESENGEEDGEEEEGKDEDGEKKENGGNGKGNYYNGKDIKEANQKLTNLKEKANFFSVIKQYQTDEDFQKIFLDAIINTTKSIKINKKPLLVTLKDLKTHGLLEAPTSMSGRQRKYLKVKLELQNFMTELFSLFAKVAKSGKNSETYNVIKDFYKQLFIIASKGKSNTSNEQERKLLWKKLIGSFSNFLRSFSKLPEMTKGGKQKGIESGKNINVNNTPKASMSTMESFINNIANNVKLIFEEEEEGESTSLEKGKIFFGAASDLETKIYSKSIILGPKAKAKRGEDVSKFSKGGSGGGTGSLFTKEIKKEVPVSGKIYDIKEGDDDVIKPIIKTFVNSDFKSDRMIIKQSMTLPGSIIIKPQGSDDNDGALVVTPIKSNPNWFKGPIEVKINKNAYAYKGTTPFTGKLMLQPRK